MPAVKNLKKYIVFSHELINDEIHGGGDLGFLGEEQEYHQYYYIDAKNKKDAIKNALEIIYDAEVKDIYYLRHTISAFFREVIYEPFEGNKKLSSEDEEVLLDLSSKMNEKFWNESDNASDDKENYEIEDEVFKTFDLDTIASSLSPDALKFVWEEFSARGRIGILEMKELNSDNWF